MTNLFYSPSQKKYYCPDPGKCTNCDDEIENVMAHVRFWNKKESWSSNYCLSCFGHIKGHALVKEGFTVACRYPPKDAHPVLQRPPQLTNSNEISVFDAAKLESKKTVDRTVHAGRESIEGAGVGNLEYKKRHEALLEGKG